MDLRTSTAKRFSSTNRVVHGLATEGVRDDTMAIGRVRERPRWTKPRIPAGMGIVRLAWVKGDESGGGG